MTFRRAAIDTFQEGQHGRGERRAFDEIVRSETIGPETPNRHARAVERQRRDDHVDARAVLQPGINHRARLVDAATDGTDDPFDDLHQVLVVAEDDVRLLDPTVALDEHLAGLVDQNVGDLGVLEQQLQRSETKELVEHVRRQRFALEQAQRNRLALAVEDRADDASNLGLGVQSGDLRQPIEIQPVEKLLMDAPLQLLKRAPSGFLESVGRGVARPGETRLTLIYVLRYARRNARRPKTPAVRWLACFGTPPKIAGQPAKRLGQLALAQHNAAGRRSTPRRLRDSCWEWCGSTGTPTTLSTSSFAISAALVESIDHGLDLRTAVACAQRLRQPSRTAKRRELLAGHHDDRRGNLERVERGDVGPRDIEHRDAVLAHREIEQGANALRVCRHFARRDPTIPGIRRPPWSSRRCRGRRHRPGGARSRARQPR